MKQQGASKLEFTLALAVIAVAAVVILERLAQLEEYAEKTAMDATVLNITAGLRAEIGNYIIHGEENRIAALTGSNPLRWLTQPPPGYLGELAAPPRAPADGAWWFETSRRALCYRPKLRHRLVVGDAEAGLCWRIEPVGGSGSSSGRAAVAWVRLAPLGEYRWF